jgi:hypothetical protein
MPTRSSSPGAIWRLAVLSPALQACYSYARIDSQAPALPLGHYVEVQITDRGRVGLGERFGPGVRQINGTVVSQQDNQLVLSVDRIANIDGEMGRWSGDTARIERDFIGSMTERRVSTSRTALLAAAAGAAIYFTAASGILGGGKDREDEPSGPINQSNRIPLRPRASGDVQFRLWRIFVP